MKNALLLLTFLTVALVPSATMAKKARLPRVNYVLPAGGQQGTTVEVLAVGFWIHHATDAVISGDGVHVKVLKGYPWIRPVDREQRKMLRQEIALAMKELQEKGKVLPSQDARIEDLQIKDGKPDPEGLPIHPVIDKLRDPTVEDLQRIVYEYFAPRQRLTPSAAFSTKVLLEVTIDRDATPGDREIRLISPRGLTNPMYFQVGTSPEVLEAEPNNPENLPAEKRIKTPVVINGQIRPGDVDRFRFRATRGQNLVLSAQARRLVPYLADAVPGWFEAVVTLYDPDGKEVDFSDCYRFDPDPILLHRITRTGDYIVEIRDSIYRGREDFVYRLSIGRAPLTTGIMPLGGRQSKPLEVTLIGEHLPAKTLKLDTSPGKGRFRQAHFIGKKWCPYAINYAVDTLPECKEAECKEAECKEAECKEAGQNDTRQTAQAVSLPTIVNGTIDRPGDVDWFRLQGKADQKIVVEVVARQLHSPLDSLIQLTDATGKVLASNDDFETPNIGLQTHHADSYLSMALPKTGDYFVHLCDTRNHGSPIHGYRLRISRPQPDFMVCLAPSSISVPVDRAVPIRFKALRKDGFTGPIEIRPAKTSSEFTLQDATIPAGQDEVVCTLTAPSTKSKLPISLHLEAYAQKGDREIVRPIVPVDDWEQAFIYKHLVPAEELMVAVTRTRGYKFDFRLAESGPALLPVDKKTTVRLTSQTPHFRKQIARHPDQLKPVLADAPQGISLADSKITPDRLELTFHVDGKATENTKENLIAGNLIVEVFKETDVDKKDGSGKKRARWSVGFLPPIPFTVVTDTEKVAGK